jgi:putative Mg2+ transporter-C (MgtC) family protein
MSQLIAQLRFADGFHMWAAIARLMLAVVCGGLIGIERERKRRPAGFRTHILICLGAALTTLTSQYIYVYLGMFTDLARLGAQVISGIGFIGAGTIIVTKRRQVKGLTTAAGLWTSAIVGLAAGAGFVEATLIATALVLLAELVLSRFEWYLMSTARDINLYVEYARSAALSTISEILREYNVAVSDLQITKPTDSSKHPCAIFTLQIPYKLGHDKLMTAIARVEDVVSVEEL